MNNPDNPFEETPEVLRARLVAETARIEWRALQRFFAAGRAVHVRDGTDLVEVACVLATDDHARLDAHLRAGAVAPVADDAARRWYDADAVVWAVVVRPWVLVQPVPD